MRHGFRWVAALLVLVLVLPAAAGALPAAKVGSRIESWNPWSRIFAFVSGLFGAEEGGRREPPQIEAGCGVDPNGVVKCDS